MQTLPDHTAHALHTVTRLYTCAVWSQHLQFSCLPTSSLFIIVKVDSWTDNRFYHKIQIKIDLDQPLQVFLIC